MLRLLRASAAQLRSAPPSALQPLTLEGCSEQQALYLPTISPQATIAELTSVSPLEIFFDQTLGEHAHQVKGRARVRVSSPYAYPYPYPYPYPYSYAVLAAGDGGDQHPQRRPVALVGLYPRPRTRPLHRRGKG